jgi:hypothetical protein
MVRFAMNKTKILNRIILKVTGRNGIRAMKSVAILFIVLGSIFCFGFISSFELFVVESGRRIASRDSYLSAPKLTVVIRNEQGGAETQEVHGEGMG